MLIQLGEYFKPTNPTSKSYKAKVVSNADPKKLRRVKVNIQGILEESNIDKLPWVYNRVPSSSGGSTTQGPFMVPTVGSYLEVIFPFDDIYAPFYIGHWTGSDSTPSGFGADYPNTYGFKDDSGNIVKVNKTQGTLNFTHSSGFTIDVDSSGNYTVNAPGDAEQIVNGKYTVNASGDIELISGGVIKSTTPTEFEVDSPLVKLGTGAAFHATLSENLIAYNDAHTHPPHAPLVGGPILPPVVPMAAKAGTALDVSALSILLKGN